MQPDLIAVSATGSRELGKSLREWLLRSRSTTGLLVERLSILHTSPNELRPVRHYGNGIGLFREESPERRMVPAEFMPSAVTMPTDTSSQRLYLIDELLTRHRFEVFVHTPSWPPTGQIFFTTRPHGRNQCPPAAAMRPRGGQALAACALQRTPAARLPPRDGGVPHASRRPVQDLKAFVLQQADRLKAHANAMAERAGCPYEYFESPGCLCPAGLAKAVMTALRCVFEPMARLRRPPRTRFSW